MIDNEINIELMEQIGEVLEKSCKEDMMKVVNSLHGAIPIHRALLYSLIKTSIAVLIHNGKLIVKREVEHEQRR